MSDMPSDDSLKSSLINVLSDNQRGDFTIPAGHLYEHQWLWDSCFISIGIAEYDIERAKKEILHLLRGQWTNGMIPHTIFSSPRHPDATLWRSYVSPYAPEHIATSGITQPPLLAEAVWRIGQKLSATERRAWYHKTYHHIVKYHSWLYEARDPHNEGLVILVHPWESGFDNSPVWTQAMYDNTIPWWILLIDRLPTDWLINKIRRDTRYVRSAERSTTLEALLNHHVLQRLRAKAYNSDRILLRSHFQIQDLAFNSILIRNNHILESIAIDIKETLPETLQEHIKKADESLHKLWDEESGRFYSRNFISHKLSHIDTIMNFMPLYSGIITDTQKERLLNLLKNHNWHPHFPIPTVPTNSEFFHAERYWQGPTWINTNWLIIDGLKRLGEYEMADKIKTSSINLVQKSGPHEYFNPLTGDPLGAKDFSWSAALVINLLNQ